MTDEQLKEKIMTLLPGAVFEENKQYLTVTVAPDEFHGLARILKDSADTAFDYLVCLTGVDYGAALGVVYHLESSVHRHFIVLKTRTEDRDQPVLPSVSDIWLGAELHEDEVYDLLGIRFTGHPDLRRLFLWDEWQGYPLRKDYKDEINIIEL